ncbi:MAG: phosphoribosylformylglycinamidine synthase subunit PurL [Planctomycetota bacterium]
MRNEDRTSNGTAWRIELRLRAGCRDAAGETLAAECRHLLPAHPVLIATVDGYAVRGPAERALIERLAFDVLADPVLHEVEIVPASQCPVRRPGSVRVDVVKRPGVMDPSAASVQRAAQAAGIAIDRVRTYRGFHFAGDLSPVEVEQLARRLLANDVIEEIVLESARLILPAIEPPEQRWKRCTVPLAPLDEAGLERLSAQRGLALSLIEMQAIRDHFTQLGRDPTDLELETLAQTWSEHCKHKTLTGPVEMDGRVIEGILQSTIFDVTRELAPPWCLSVFKDNAGVIAFDDEYALTFKVETHNHPSAIEPYGGAGTGIGGVLRDTLGTGRGARPILSTDVFCVGPQDLPPERLPKGALHPRRVLRGVVAGVRDYGNRMGVPTAAGAVFFDERYVGNPLVFCGNVGLIPRRFVSKGARPGDLIVLAGGRTGRDGIHGATFSSLELHEDSETLSSGAVQIGNAIEEKKLLDVVLAARDRELFTAVTDCGAGGLSSAVGEMGAHCGAEVDLETVPLKYHGLTYSEIWISEAQERMVLAVPPEHSGELLELFRSEDVETTVIGRYTSSGHLVVRYHGEEVGRLEMVFLHEGVPRVTRRAVWKAPAPHEPERPRLPDVDRALPALLGMPNIASKEWIIRQYDHEVLAGSALKPLVGPASDGPGDACVVAPRLGQTRGFAVSHGMNPCYGDLDPYGMALLAVDEALRNVICAGARIDRTAILDNFAWGATDNPDRLGSLIQAARGCRDAALAYSLPFISGKDSLNNEFRTATGSIAIPPSLLISALGIIDDVRDAVSMDLKEVGSSLLLVGLTDAEFGGSHYFRWLGLSGGRIPRVDLDRARSIHKAVESALQSRRVLACHDLSEGGLAVAAAEMAIAGRVGLTLELAHVPCRDSDLPEDARLFAESAPRYLLEVHPAELDSVLARFSDLPHAVVGHAVRGSRLTILGRDGSLLATHPLDLLVESFKMSCREQSAV